MNISVSLSTPRAREELPQGILPTEIANLDLSHIREKLVERATVGREANCPPVELDALDAAIEDYKRYLFLNLKYPGFPIAPSYDIDEVWHQHILFTRRYFADCKAIFGEMRHHVPHFGRNAGNPEEDTRILDNTRALWKREFGFVPKSYDGMTALTSDNGWSGNIDLSKTDPNFWDAQTAVLRS